MTFFLPLAILTSDFSFLHFEIFLQNKSEKKVVSLEIK